MIKIRIQKKLKEFETALGIGEKGRKQFAHQTMRKSVFIAASLWNL